MLDRITVVLAQWCPHCVPLSLEKGEQMAKQLGVELRVLDIDDPEQEKIADSLVKDYGDPADDYLIPQVFFEEDGKVKHVFTGFSEGVDVTRARWDDFFASEYYQAKLGVHKKPN
jgi:thiol-disulfide isomerase/thioredoxin